MVDYTSLVRELLKYGGETPWIEFKENLTNPESIAERLCGLANAAAIHQRQYGYMVWGIRDSDLAVIGTTFNPQKEKRGNEHLFNWLRHTISDNADFTFAECEFDGKRLVILTVKRAILYPVKYASIPYIRDQTVTKPLNKVPQLEFKLWNELNKTNYDLLPARIDVAVDDVKKCIDYEGSMRLTGVQFSDNDDYIMHVLCDQKIISRQDDGNYSITNMGALLFCRSFKDFPSIERRALRIIQYNGSTSANISREITENRGYALSFEDDLRAIDLMLPSEEIFVNGVRHQVRQYSEIAIRELLANAIIHQDLTITGMNLSVEIFENRVEISNPGTMMVEEDRILDSEPISRNESIASMMRKIGLCEELGSGWDRVVESCEENNLPIPIIKKGKYGTKIIINKAVQLKNLSDSERIWNCYMHSCLMFTSGQGMTNTSLRQRLGLESTPTNSVTVSRLIKQTQEAGMIKPLNPESSKRSMMYVPYWA